MSFPPPRNLLSNKKSSCDFHVTQRGIVRRTSHLQRGADVPKLVRRFRVDTLNARGALKDIGKVFRSASRSSSSIS